MATRRPGSTCRPAIAIASSAAPCNRSSERPVATSVRDNQLHGAGIGLRLPHLAELVATRPNVDWLEIHPENFLANPHATELLLDLAREIGRASCRERV